MRILRDNLNAMKLSKEKQQHLAVVVMVTVIVTVALWYFAISGQHEQISKIETKLNDISTSVGNAQARVKESGTVEEILFSRSNELALVEAEMASGNDQYFWFISTLNKFKIPYPMVAIPFVSKPADVELGVYQSFPYKAKLFQLRGVAYFHDFGQFLADFENRFPHFRTQKLNLYPVPPDASADGEKISFEFEVVTLLKPK